MERDDITTEYLAHLVRTWLREQGKSQTELARLSGLSNGTISCLISGERGAGRKVLRNLAKVFGTTADALESAAIAWMNRHNEDGSGQVVILPPPSPPGLEAAIKKLRKMEWISEETVAEARSEYARTMDLDEEIWITVLINRERRRNAKQPAKAAG